MRAAVIVGVSVALSAVFVPVRAEEKPAKFDAAKMAGNWEIISGEKEGTKSEADALKGKIEITKDTIKILGGPEGKDVFLMKYKLDLDKKPVTIVMDGTEGLIKDQTVKGIVAFDGDNLKLCYSVPGEDFPKDFKTKEGSKSHSFVLKKVK
jgi:uncharacterized protein (TIGR03067 family)